MLVRFKCFLQGLDTKILRTINCLKEKGLSSDVNPFDAGGEKLVKWYNDLFPVSEQCAPKGIRYEVRFVSKGTCYREDLCDNNNHNISCCCILLLHL